MHQVDYYGAVMFKPFGYRYLMDSARQISFACARKNVCCACTSFLLMAFVLACDSPQPAEEAPATLEPAAVDTRQAGLDVPEPNKCVFIILDAAAAGHFSYYGYERETSPAFDAFARDGVAFAAAQSTSPNTLTSARTYLTGQHLSTPPEGQFYSYYRLPEDAETVASAFADRGFETLGLSQNPNISIDFGFDTGFTHFNRYQQRGRVETPDGRAFDQPARALLEEAKTWIGEREDGAWFCYLHLLRPHNPYLSPEPFGSLWNKGGVQTTELDGKRVPVQTLWFAATGELDLSDEQTQYLTDLYDGNVAFTDSLVKDFLDWLKAEDLFESTLVIVTSDHGEAFMEHRRIAHSTTVYNEMIHVPLAFSAPAGLGFQRGVIEAPVSLVDIFPTLAELYGLAPKAELHGRSLAPLLRGETPEQVPALFARTDDLLEVAVRTGDAKVFFRRPDLGSAFEAVEVYDLANDPTEQVNLIEEAGSGEIVSRADAALKAFGDEHWSDPPPTEKGPPRMSEDVLEELRSLGYIGDN